MSVVPSANNPFQLSDRAVQNSWPQRETNQSQPGQGTRWIRKLDLIVYDSAGDSGEGLNLTPDGYVQFQVQFQIKKSTNQSPNLFYARVYNLHPDTIAKVVNFRRVGLNAGWRTGPYGTLFLGTVVQYKRGKENATDTYLEIYAGDGDRSTGFDVVTGQWDAGTTNEQLAKDMISRSSLQLGTVNLGRGGSEQLVRSLTENRMLSDALRAIGNTTNSDWWVDNGKVNFIVRSAYMPGEAVVLTPQTGLIGIPEVTPQGIQVRCLLDPNLQLGGLVKIDTALLSGVPFLPGSGAVAPVSQEETEKLNEQFGNLSIATWGQQLLLPAFTSPTGTYKILLMDISGETRGNAYYADLVCVALDATGNFIDSPQLPYQRTRVQSNTVGNSPAGGGGE